MKLLLHPLGETDMPNLRDVAGPRPERQSIQCLQDLSIRAEFLFERIGRLTKRGRIIAAITMAMENTRFISLVPPRSGIYCLSV